MRWAQITLVAVDGIVQIRVIFLAVLRVKSGLPVRRAGAGGVREHGKGVHLAAGAVVSPLASLVASAQRRTTPMTRSLGAIVCVLEGRESQNEKLVTIARL